MTPHLTPWFASSMDPEDADRIRALTDDGTPNGSVIGFASSKRGPFTVRIVHFEATPSGEIVPHQVVGAGATPHEAITRALAKERAA